ncbi:MAG: LysM peptidoglycan-binding domain-containing protein [Cytophagales bacterium]|nr:LysM peptidoglycan-binding domain-containing protein [Cytophagales bacterium]
MKNILLRYIIFNLLILFYANIAHTATYDSLGVVTKDNKKMVLYQSTNKETLFSISKKYKTTVQELIKINPELEQGLKIGQKILIPLPEPIAKPSLQAGYTYHKVEAGQTMYGLSKRYGISIEELKEWNQLTTNELKPGSQIIVGMPKTPAADTSITLLSPLQTTKTTKNPTGYDKKIDNDVVTLFDTPNGDTYYYALHKSASTGTVLYLTNNSGLGIFVRVIGKTLPGVVGIQVSKAAMEKLKTDDKQAVMPVSVEYMPD